jgi:predicted Zn finger-like uncharacterized protein
MIISCTNCKKKFTVDSSLIPEKGRLLQCNNCNYKWFFKKEATLTFEDPINIKNLEITRPTNYRQKNQDLAINISDINNEIIINDEKSFEKMEEIIIEKKKETKKKSNILKPILVFIISFVVLIILIDTFKYPISKIVPNIESILYSLYETIKDISLFLKDLT